MKVILYLSFMFITSYNLFGQSQNFVDSLSNEICKSIGCNGIREVQAEPLAKMLLHRLMKTTGLKIR